MKVSWRAQATASVIGTVVGIGGWLLGVGRRVWPAHPGWALFWMTIVVTVLTMMLVSLEENGRPS